MQAEETFDPRAWAGPWGPHPSAFWRAACLSVGFHCLLQVPSYLLPTCYPPTEHPTLLFSEARVKHLGVQDGLSPLRCELPRSPLCGPRFLPLQTGLGSELLGPLLPSLSLSLPASPPLSLWFTLGPGFSDAGAYPPRYSTAPSHSCLGLTCCKRWPWNCFLPWVKYSSSRSVFLLKVSRGAGSVYVVMYHRHVEPCSEWASETEGWQGLWAVCVGGQVSACECRQFSSSSSNIRSKSSSSSSSSSSRSNRAVVKTWVKRVVVKT